MDKILLQIAILEDLGIVICASKRRCGGSSVDEEEDAKYNDIEISKINELLN